MSLKIDMYISVADPAVPPTPTPSPSLFLDQTEARREYLRVWMTAPTPPPLYKGLDDRGPPLSQGLKYHTPSPARLRADVLIFPSYLLLRSLVGLSASLTRDLGTRLFSHYFCCFYIYFIDFIFSSLDICFIPFTFGTTVLIGPFVNI